MNFRIASFNIRVDLARDKHRMWKFRKWATRRRLKSLNCSIVGLQEALDRQVADLLKGSHNISHVGKNRDDASIGERCAVLFDSNLWKLREENTRWYGKTPDQRCFLEGAPFPRIYTYVSLLSAEGHRIDIYNTHLDHKSEDRRAQSMDQLLNTIDSTIPTVIMGDFNAERDSRIFSRLSKYGLRFAHSENAPGTFNYWGRAKREPTIDHILVSEQLNVISAEVSNKKVFGFFPSDHWPVVAELQFNTRMP